MHESAVHFERAWFEFKVLGRMILALRSVSLDSLEI